MSDAHMIHRCLGEAAKVSLNMVPKPASDTIIDLQGKSFASVLVDAGGQSGNVYKLPAASSVGAGAVVILVCYDNVGGGDGVLIKDSTAATTHATLEPGEVAIAVSVRSASSTYAWTATVLKQTGAT